MEVFMGSILPFGFNFPPSSWALANGQLIAISQNDALYALIGTTYGGDGVNTFQLPNLQGRSLVGMGSGPGLSPRFIGEVFGAENATVPINTGNMPPHSHTLAASNTDSTSLTQAPVAGWTLGAAASNSGGDTPVITPVNMYNPAAVPAQTAVQSAPTSTVGGGAPLQVATLPPALCLNFCIALYGIFPSRN